MERRYDLMDPAYSCSWLDTGIGYARYDMIKDDQGNASEFSQVDPENSIRGHSDIQTVLSG